MNSLYLKGDERGFTLLELTASMGLITIVLAVSLNYFISTLATSVEIEKNVDQRQNAARALQYITKEVRSSKAFISPQPGKSGNRLEMSHGIFPWERVEIYKRAGGEVWVAKNHGGGAGHNPIAYNIEDINFTILPNNKTVIIELYIGDEDTKVISSAVSLREELHD